MKGVVDQQPRAPTRREIWDSDEGSNRLREAAAMLRAIAAEERRRERAGGPLVRAARAVERALGIGR
jgi:hypothetical protein